MIRQFSKAAAVRFFVTITDMSGAGAVDDSDLAEEKLHEHNGREKGKLIFLKKGFPLDFNFIL
ncbi:hypothetical protein [Salmonella enterica]|uniref:hypothetical protein n=1 Tax=Salmonella enterica TaxID=28901 RepID=UPI0009A96D70|nr:hypothetical protein [Salmonella enterica]ECF3883014.1 hypothetical protein [Salmonella enterica subsp. enterica serovar Ank]EDA8441720.1 hypothetical protein [Salmonella enterica subsp. enterica serovar Bakau]